MSTVIPNGGSRTSRDTRRSVAIIGSRGYPSFYGGSETLVRKLAPYLAERGWRVTVYARNRNRKLLLDPGVRTVTTLGIDSRNLSTVTHGATAALHATWARPDVALVLNVANGFFLPALKLRNIPTVVNVDGIEWERAKWGRLAQTVFHQGAAASARYADTLVADSREIGLRWKREFGRETRYIPYGGVVEPLLPVPDGLEHRKYILYVARFVPENSVEEFFAAVPELATKMNVVIVGSSGYGGRFDEAAKILARTYSTVSWTGQISNDERLHGLWQHAGVYFHGHSVGGTNPALVQAMACGAPIVARDSAYNREVLTESCGEFVEAVPESIVRTVERLAISPEVMEGLSNAAKERAERSYAWEDVCRSYEEVLIETAALAVRQI